MYAAARGSPVHGARRWPATPGLILEYEGVTLKDVYDARMALETPMVVQLAKVRNPAVIAELEGSSIARASWTPAATPSTN